MLIRLASLYLTLLPFQWALSPSPGFDLALSRVFALILILVWTAEGLKRKSMNLLRPIPLFLFTGFLLLSILSFFIADSDGFAGRKLIFIWNFFPLVLVFSFLLTKDANRRMLIGSFVFGASLAALVGIVQFFSQFAFGVSRVFDFWLKSVLPFFLGDAFSGAVSSYPSLLVNISGATLLRASAFFPDPHMYAFYLGLALPFALALSTGETGKRRILFFLASLCILVADLLSFSRGGYIGLFSGLIILAFAFRDRIRSIFSPALFSAVTILLLLLFIGTPIGSRLFSSFTLEDGSNAERVRLWEQAATVIRTHPLEGVGIGNYPLFVKPSASYREPIYVHNLFLDISVEMGILAALSFFGLLWYALLSGYADWRRTGRMLSLAPTLSLSIFFGHSLFETPLYSVQVLPVFLFVISIGLAAAMNRK